MKLKADINELLKRKIEHSKTCSQKITIHSETYSIKNHKIAYIFILEEHIMCIINEILNFSVISYIKLQA